MKIEGGGDCWDSGISYSAHCWSKEQILCAENGQNISIKKGSN